MSGFVTIIIIAFKVVRRDSFSKVTVVNLMQPLKADAPIVSTLAGILIEVSDEQYRNAP